MNAAFLAKALDIGTMGDTPALFASAAGADVVVVATGHSKPNGLLQIVARPGSGIRSLSDLRGKSIATTRATALHGYLLLALHRAGLQQGDIRLIDVPLVALGRTLQSGDADAAVLAGPQIVSYLAQQKDAVQLDAPDGEYNVILATRRALADAPTRAALRDFVQRSARAGQWVEAHPDVWRERYYQGLQHQDAATAQAIMARQQGYHRYFQPVDDALRAHLERQAELLTGAGVLPTATETIARLFDPAVTQEFNKVIKEASS
jgi:sulfonate transport system substrate-binding protein